MIGLLRKLFCRSYSISIKGPAIYVVWHRPLEQWSSRDHAKYLPQLREAMSKTVTADIWKLLQEHESHEDEWYKAYVDGIKEQLCKDFNLDMIGNKVITGYYHGDMLVIGFKANKDITYPNYYRAIQLKPYFN